MIIFFFSELKEAFMLFDYMKSGHIYADDIGPVIRSIGLKPSELQIRAIRKDVGQGERSSRRLFSFIVVECRVFQAAKLIWSSLFVTSVKV